MIHFKDQLEEELRRYCTNEISLKTVSISDSDDYLAHTIEQNITFVQNEQDLITKNKSYTVSVKSDATIYYPMDSHDRSLRADTQKLLASHEVNTDVNNKVDTSRTKDIGFFIGFIAGFIAT